MLSGPFSLNVPGTLSPRAANFERLVPRDAGRAAGAGPVLPRVGEALGRLVRIGVRRHTDAWVEPVEAVIHLQHGLAIAREVVGHPEPRHKRVPFHVVS